MKTEREMFETIDNYMGFNHDTLHKFFYFNNSDGSLYHKRRDISDFKGKLNPLLSVNAWNARWADKKAGNINKVTGYLKVKLKGVNLSNHRVIYLMTHGFLPKELFIDHIDGNKLNNLPNNLRPVSNAENIQNQRKAQVTSRLKVLGVSITSSGKYQARIVQNGKSMYLGSFKTIEEAKNSYLKAKRELHVSQ